jgi:hypothetical protein
MSFGEEISQEEEEKYLLYPLFVAIIAVPKWVGQTEKLRRNYDSFQWKDMIQSNY